jgi:group II intron reverse transcriptase/maturase
MSTNIAQIGEKASREPKLVFTSLYHHVTDMDNLRASYQSMNGRKATGVDGVTKESYGKELERNLEDLSARLKRMGYKPKPKRRSYIPKPGKPKGRPLGISCFEDKIVEEMVKRVLEPIYETVFLPCSYGYRPERNQHQCVDLLGKLIQQRRISHVVEADIKGFFDQVNHEWLIKFLEVRIGDPRMIRLIIRMLKGGIMEDGLVRATEEGTSQGSILSPLLSNIYLHYTLDLWFAKVVQKKWRGEAYLIRYADDFVVLFQYKDEAARFREELGDRLQNFHLELAEDKTKCLEFGRFAREDARKRGKKPEEFTFLGFTYYCGKTKNGKFKVKRRTSRKKLTQAIKKFGDWCQSSRNKLSKGAMLRSARTRIRGHLNYYAITDNSKSCVRFIYYAERALYKWINRKSQRKAYNWKQFNQARAWVGWPKSRIVHNLCPFRPLNVE